MKATGMDKAQASDVMLDSKTWADHRESNLKLRETLSQALLEWSVENTDPDFEIIIESDDPNDRKPES